MTSAKFDADGDADLRYEWQSWVDGFGADGQRKLGQARVLVSRIGGVGGTLAFELAAAGVGSLVLAHAGTLRWNDLNRQLLMSPAGVGQSRVIQAAERLREFNPAVTIDAIAENVTDSNIGRLADGVDLIISCAPIFSERLAMNREAVRRRIPFVDAAMYDWDIQLTVVKPGESACLACLIPEPPAHWKREFPVFGAVAGTVGCMGASEAIKLIGGVGDSLAGYMLLGDLRSNDFRKVRVNRRSDCEVCGTMQ